MKSCNQPFIPSQGLFMLNEKANIKVHDEVGQRDLHTLQWFTDPSIEFPPSKLTRKDFYNLTLLNDFSNTSKITVIKDVGDVMSRYFQQLIHFLLSPNPVITSKNFI